MLGGVVRPVNDRSRRRRRAGAHLLSLFATPLNGLILRALAEGPLPPPALREAVGWPAPSTLRGNLESLAELGAVAMRRGKGRPRLSDSSLTPLGEELLGVADALEAWLADAPAGPIELGGGASKAAIGALVEAWDTTIVRALAPGPLSLTELNDLISGLSYPTLSRRLAAMHFVGQVERRNLEGPRRVYRVTDWLRRAVAPLAAAARCELRHLGETAPPVTWVEVESAFLLAMPLVSLPEATGGDCTLAVDTGACSARSRLAGVRVEVRDGRVTSCSTRLAENPGTWALGTAESWLDAAFADDSTGLHAGGETPDLPMGMVAAIREALALPASLVRTA
jgi:DNA-binding HxlR family transcriptional regulator